VDSEVGRESLFIFYRDFPNVYNYFLFLILLLILLLRFLDDSGIICFLTQKLLTLAAPNKQRESPLGSGGISQELVCELECDRETSGLVREFEKAFI